MVNISDFKGAFGVGARPNLFSVTMHYPTGIAGFSASGRSASFLAKAAQLPASTVNFIDVPFRGRQVKVPGDRTFEDWTITITNNEGFDHRAALEAWMNNLNSHQENVSAINDSEIYADAHVDQLNRQGQILRSYTIRDMFPTNIAAVELAFDTNDTISEFTATFAILHWESTSTS